MILAVKVIIGNITGPNLKNEIKKTKPYFKGRNEKYEFKHYQQKEYPFKLNGNIL